MDTVIIDKLSDLDDVALIDDAPFSETGTRKSVKGTDGLDLIQSVFLNRDEMGRCDWRDISVLKKLMKCGASDIPLDLQSWTEVIHVDDRRDYKRAIASLAWEGARIVKRYRIQRSDLTWLWVEETAERLSEDAEFHTRAIIRDVSHEVKGDANIAWRARHDDVTGCLNKTAFSGALETLLALSKRLDTQGSVFRIRLTNLDNIHRVYGFEAGKIILEAVCERLRDLVRAPDSLGVDGETDFLLAVIALTGVDSDPEKLKARLDKALSYLPFVTPFGRIKIDLDISYVEFSDTSEASLSAEAIIQKTFTALEPQIEAENDASDAAHTDGFEPHIEHHDITKGDIISALNERRISLAYQPIVHARTGELHHYECLLRLRKDDGTLESAGQLIMAAETLGLVHWLDRRALEIATKTLIEKPSLKLALNVSAVTLTSDKARDGYLESLKALGHNAGQVTLELTETAALNDPTKASAFSTAVRALGCEFSIDDFGSGHTSFRNLMAIEAETIKIDGSLIQGIATTPQMQNFVRMMVDLAQTFSVKTVAEMVEDQADAVLLRRLGVDYLQGYLFGMPSATPNYKA